MNALKDNHVDLARELQSCKEELEQKSQQYEAAESQRQVLQRAYSKLEEGFKQVAGEIEDCRGKVRFLAGENAELLRQNGSLSQQAERAKEEKTQLVSELRGLCCAVFNKYDFRDESTAMEAIRAAFNKLGADCDSLREKEAAATKRAEDLDAEKGSVGSFGSATVQEECACQQSTIVFLKAENEGLHDAITKFEQIAQTRAEDLVRAEGNKSLEDALAAAKKEITPLEEREKAASLLLEKDTHIAQLETKLKETEEWVAKLEHKNAATSNAAELLREYTEGLSSTMAGLVAALNLERERRENRIDCDSQTEGTRKAVCGVRTDGTLKVDCDVQTENSAKVDANVQTENVAKESNVNLIGTPNACSSLNRQVKKLKKQELLSLIASKEREAKEHLEANARASAALKAKNEKLKAKVSRLRNRRKSLRERLLYESNSRAMNKVIFKQTLREKQEEVNILKKQVALLKENADATPPVHKVVVSAEQKPAQVAAEKLAVVTSTPVTKPGESVASASKVPSPMVVASAEQKPAQVVAEKLAVVASTPVTKPGEPVASTSKVPSPMSCVTAEDARPSDKALSGSPLKRTLSTDQDRVDHPVNTKETAVTSLPPSAQSTAPQPVTKKRRFFTSRSGH